MSTSSNTTFEFDVNHNGEFKLNPLTYQHGSLLNIYVPQMGFEDMVSYLKWKIPRQFNTLYYMLPPNYALSGMKQIKNDYHTNVMYDIAKVAGKLQIFVAHTPIDLSTVLIPNDGSFEQSLTGVISVETKIKLEESLKYLHQMQKRKNKKFDYYGLWGELGFINKTKPHTPYTQTFFNFVVHNSGQLVLDETNNTMYVNGGTFNINIPRMKLADLKQYLLNIVAQYKLEIYIDHIGVNFVIHKYIFPNASLAEMMNHVITDYSSENEGIISNPENVRLTVLMKLQEAIDEEAILEEQILALMHRFADRFTDRRVEINNLMVLHDHPLVDYGKYALGCMTGADMKKCVYLKSVRDELLRSMEEKRQLMANYKDM
ncbi:hypothetical protein Tco_0939093 [Tanacetum coccineum]|uniref:Uncharacterized protein n=1 Tax=Tanacetum coccineum TaxID=301880 RepID=A0ABQ5DKU0_9ASTR